jgi:DNA-binding Xre family transcriptional regulator
MLAARIRKADLARKAGISKSQVERLLDLGHKSQWDQVEAAFRALNKRVGLLVHDAA